MATAGATRGPGPERAFLAKIPSAGTVRLDADEGHHLVRVRRARTGDAVVLFDGRGGSMLARLVEADAKGPSLAIEGPYPDREPGRVVCIASAVPGPSRLDDLITALAELGVATWVPLACERSDRGALDGLARRRDRVARLVREAAKVSGRSRFLDVAEPVTLAEALTRPGGRGAVLLDPDPQAPRLVDLLRSSREESGVLLLVGPEGGFTEAELQAALEAGVRPASLGACALRTELAAIVAAGIAVGSP